MADDFITALLGQLKAPVTPQATTFLNAWRQAEGTAAAFNPLATTQTAAGSYALPGNAAINNGIAVQQYPDFQTGLLATAKTLQNGYYGPIVEGLRSGKATAAQLAQAVADSPWGTGRGVLNVLGSPGGARLPATTTAVPAGPAAPVLPSMGAPAVTPVKTQSYGNLAGALLGSLGKSPGAQLNAIVNTLPKTIPTSKPGVSVAAPTHLQEPGGETGAPPGTPATKGTSSVVAAAMKYLGTPYSWGGGGPGGPSFGIQQGANTKGFDCSGLLEYAYAKQGVAIGGTTYEQWPRGQSVDRKNLRPGDAVFFHMADGYPQHVGIFMGGDKFLEAPHTGANVRVSDLSSRSDFVGARRYG